MKRDSSTPGGPPDQTALAFGNEFYSSVDRGLEFDAWFEASASGDFHWNWKRIVFDYDNQRVGVAILNDTVQLYNMTSTRDILSVTVESDFSFSKHSCMQVLTMKVNADRFDDDACTNSQIVGWKAFNSVGPWAWRLLEGPQFGAAGPIGLFQLRIPFQQNESRPVR